MPTAPALLIANGALLGAIVGSFVATLAVRWPLGHSVTHGRSSCDGCGTPIGAAHLVPIFSFLVQRGRASCCGAAIDRIHPVAEILAAGIGALSFAAAPDPVRALAGALLGWLLLALALLDARAGWLPDRLTLPLAMAGVAAGLAGLSPALLDRLIGGGAAFILFAAIRLGYRQWRGREGMGGGDVKLFGAIGLWLGWRPLPMVLLGAALAGLLWSLGQRLGGKPVTTSSSVRFGSFLALAGWTGWIAGEAGWAAFW
jgi:leader peptidase (prepilin peptidase)/N-methyltransferase